ncbi:MAG TPA: hypothetical protein VGH27_07440 [Streptosporangiaceae bacterium]|jgi:hypothetical protein
MTRLAPLDGSEMPEMIAPLIDPDSLNRAQIAGRRCAVPNCRRPLIGKVFMIGRLPGGRPVLACRDCAPCVSYQRTEPATQAA